MQLFSHANIIKITHNPYAKPERREEKRKEMCWKESGIMQKKYVMALDAGTTSNRAIIFDEESRIVSVSQKEFSISPSLGG